MVNSKSQLAIALSRLQVFPSPKIGLEQYPTDSEVAAEVLWNAAMIGDIEGKTIADLGCGTGILGIGALLLGAKKVFFVDTDAAALAVLGNNLKSIGMVEGYEIINADMAEFDRKADVVIQNPPFGTKEKHVDKAFLEKAFTISDKVYSFHKTSTASYITKVALEKGFSPKGRWDFNFPLKQTMSHHAKRIQRIEVTCFRFVKQ